MSMKNYLRKFSVVMIVAFVGSFLASCNGTTQIYGLEKSGKKNKRYKKTNQKYQTYNYGNHRDLPPGQHKKFHGEKSAKKYAPGQNKKYKKGKGKKKH